MSSDRLTRNELTWLLTQEARSAARKLRQGVGIPKIGEVAPPVIHEEGSGGVETTLNRLDEAVSALASLHGQPVSRGRRGKIDLAALIWEIAPEARVQIEMGEGTTVFGDESELRRMLHVLLGQSGDPTSTKGTAEVMVRRNGDDVKVSVNLGPDKPATFETERAWLARMATRYGGRLELDGSMETLTLPADVDMQRRELENLKKELAAAQAQGEAYARELAAVFSRSEAPTPPMGMGGSASAALTVLRGDSLALLVASARGLGPSLRGILAAIGRDIAPLRDRQGEAGEIAASVARHVTAASEIVGDLARIGACPLGEPPRSIDVSDVLREVVSEHRVRAARHDVTVAVTTTPAEASAPPETLMVLLHALLDHAIQASPPGSQVSVDVTEQEGLVVVTFDDAGPTLPAGARAGVLSRDFEAIANGRPSGLSLIAAHAIAAHARALLEIEDGPLGGARLRLSLGRGNSEAS